MLSQQLGFLPVRLNSRDITLMVVLAVQGICAVFFFADAIEDIQESGFSEYTALEATISIALISGVLFGGLEMKRTIDRNRRAESAVSVASGALADVIQTNFDDWGLTAAESDVALFALKGFDVGEISNMRGTAEGTVRAQLTRIYDKAGVTNRIQLLSLFLDELVELPLIARNNSEGEQAS